MTIPGRLTIADDGRVIGPAALSYNVPFPCVNGMYALEDQHPGRFRRSARP